MAVLEIHKPLQAHQAKNTRRKSMKNRLGSFIYPMRIMGYSFAITSMLSFYYVFYSPTPIVWIYCATIFIYPHIAFYLYKRSGFDRKVEFNTLVFDMFLIGLISAFLKFSPIFALPYVIANSASNFASNGPRLFFQGLTSFAVGALLGILLVGFHFHYQYHVWVSVPSYVYLLLAAHYIGFISYSKGSVLRKTKQLTEEQNVELIQQKEELEALNQDIQHKHIELSKANKSIRDSISYAKHIQGAILPRTQVIQSVFPTHFIFYQPRDIVGGDFYWVYEQQNLQILVVADCTGHGVPGAFMSLIGQMFLEETIAKQQVTNPAEVLELMHQKVSRFLNQKYNGNRDGMDLAMVSYNPDHQQLQFAGAKSSILYIQDGELQKCKGCIFSIGHENYSIPVTFEQHTIQVNQTTRLYLYSDGFQDQFGGKNKKRLGSKRFAKLLDDTQHLPLGEQGKKLESFFHQWRDGGLDTQMDDVLVFGVELEPKKRPIT
ncbi:hypothetical protein BKI52_23825 [marine bacterium AO1-C]|nr:hypothetical protein BKI52_23825 [marine bacterium AO1-C]